MPVELLDWFCRDGVLAAGPGAPGSCPFSTSRSQLSALCLDCRPELTDVQGVLGSDSCPETPSPAAVGQIHPPQIHPDAAPPATLPPGFSQARVSGRGQHGRSCVLGHHAPARPQAPWSRGGLGLFSPPVLPREEPAWSGVWWA